MRSMPVVSGVVLVLFVLFVAAVSVKGPEQMAEQAKTTNPQTTPSSQQSEIGNTADLPSQGKVTLIHLYRFSESPDPDHFGHPKADHEFSAINVEACAGNEETSIDPTNFHLQMPNDPTPLWPRLAAQVKPPLTKTKLPPGQCTRGYVTFEIPSGEPPQFVVLRTTNGQTIWWRV